MKKLKTLVYVIVVLLVVAGGGYYFMRGDSSAEPAAAQLQRVVKLTKGDLNLNVSANGVVQPINKVEIKSKASGQIEQLNFVEGKFVQKGELLIALDQRTAKNDYDQAKADLAVAEASAKQTENNYKRSLELFEKGLISQQERDQANVDYVRTQAQLVKATAALSSADERLRDTRIVSPLSGVILTKNVELGQIISSGVSNVGGGTLLATIADMNEVYVETNVDEVDIGKIQVDQGAKVVADAYPDQSFNGEVIRIAPLGKTQQNVTTFNVIVLVRNIGGKLKAGMSASVDIEILNRQHVLLVPNEAIKDPRSEQGRAMLALTQKPEPLAVEMKEDSGAASGGEINWSSMSPDEIRQRMQNMSEEDRQKARQAMRERFEKMSPEERQQAFAQMGQRFGGGQGGQGGGGSMMFRGEAGSGSFTGQGGAGFRARRESQVGDENEVKRRVVMVKQGKEFVPRIIKVGANNFDFSEVIEGLNEGDEIQITSISRAKLASEAFNERMRSMQGVGGIGGSARVPTTGGGRR